MADIPADRFDGFIIDLDGVVWVGDRPLPGAPEALAALRDGGKGVIFATNDPRSSREQYVQKLRRFGIPATPADVLTSAAATAQLVGERAPGRAAFVIGSPALKEEVAAGGLRILGGEEARQADVVVVGGHEDFSYDELRIATLALRRGAELYATGRDATFPMPDGPWPATGAILAAVEVAAGRRALVVGKPEPFLFDVALRKLRQYPRVAVVGDRLDSDVVGGYRAGLGTILVLSGETRPNHLEGAEVQPDVVLPDLGALVHPRR